MYNDERAGVGTRKKYEYENVGLRFANPTYLTPASAKTFFTLASSTLHTTYSVTPQNTNQNLK